LLAGTAGAALTHGLTLAEGKGAWVANLHTFASSMAQNFWISLLSWTVCMITTIVVSLFSKPRAETELVGLVYGLTRLPKHEGVSWYKRPVPIAVCMAVLAVILNIWFA